nr:MAG TPA: hypothetical protein [Herelleviridae sp.]
MAVWNTPSSSTITRLSQNKRTSMTTPYTSPYRAL